jgi:hypothetical protein
MRLPPKTFSKYVGRLGELIAEGEAVPVRDVQVVSGGNYLKRETYYRTEQEVSWPEFVQWRTKCVTLLGQVVPPGSLHRRTVDSFDKLDSTPSALRGGVAFLKSIDDDLQNGFLDSLASDVEAEVAADLLGQATRLLEDDTSQQVGHLPAVVLAGAVLEKGLRSLCEQLTPPEPVSNATGHPLTMSPLIDALKRRGVFNEVMASQLRAWAALRNSAAHGHSDRFTKEQAQAMVSGVRHFLAGHL